MSDRKRIIHARLCADIALTEEEYRALSAIDEDESLDITPMLLRGDVVLSVGSGDSYAPESWNESALLWDLDITASVETTITCKTS